MIKDKVVQFVCFETKLNCDQFLIQWEHFNRSTNSDLDVILQHSEHNAVFRYIAQHRCIAGELNFAFTKGKKSSHTPEIGIKTKQAGGYSILQEEKKNDVSAGESKLFSFITDPTTDLSIYKQLSAYSKLNIYQAYYENCSYAYILEFFVKNKYVSVLQEQLKLISGIDCRIYHEMSVHAF
ncbi:MAG: hypothetical protein ABI402_17740 [Ferruginibacter sp.]